jgi:hypothetical protein
MGEIFYVPTTKRNAVSCVEIIFKNTHFCLSQELICDYTTVKDTLVF